MTQRPYRYAWAHAALALALLLAPATAWAGGGPDPCPAGYQAVGDPLKGEVTLKPHGEMMLKATFKGACGQKEATITKDFDTRKDVNQLEAADIIGFAKGSCIPAASLKMTPPKVCPVPAGSQGGMVIQDVTDVVIKKDGGKLKEITCKATLSYIDK